MKHLRLNKNQAQNQIVMITIC